MGNTNKYAVIVEQLKAKMKLDEAIRVAPMDLQNPSEAKRKAWAKYKTVELEELYASIAASKREIPEHKWNDWDLEAFNIIGEHKWNDWDLEAFNIIGDIIADRRAVILRDEIARMMELSGQHYAMQKNQYYKKKGLLNDMRERKKDD